MAAVRGEVEQVKCRDRDFSGHQTVLQARMLAVVGAQRALSAGEAGARYALRQSLIDLAAVAELVAAELPRPAVAGRNARRVGG
jgi:hypothetical protein